MKQAYTPVKWVTVAALSAAAVAIVGPFASAQTTATPTTSATSTTATTTKVRKAPRTSASPAMIVEAMQRSQARSDKLRATGRAEQFGSEEPFIFDPNK
jgi:hypothetical protein